MILEHRNVTVRQLPATLDTRGRKLFCSVLEECIDVVRPLLVFDCSRLQDLDASAVHFLLCCLEEVMKRNGDIRLAALSPNAKVHLELAGADGIFEIFETIADAVDSYTMPRGTVPSCNLNIESAIQAA